jgi:hypothetical protein
MSASFMDKYFGPLPREYCVYFYAMSIIFAFFFVIGLISITYFVLFHFKKVNGLFIVNSVFVLFNTLLAYLVNRLLHTMCVKSV